MPHVGVTDPAKLKDLLEAVLVIESDLELSGVLERLVKAAVDLVGARYGALGVLGTSGRSLVQFVVTGVDEADKAAIGPPPGGHGILGLLIDHPEPIRLEKLDQHPASVGFPPGHPVMTSFLGVPIRIRGQVYGNLYLTEKHGGVPFDEDDEALVMSLASAAGIAIDNARLHARVRELALSEDRERIARDLHDTVIQRIFAVALSLQAAGMRSAEPHMTERLEQAVADLDETIRQIRTAIFALEPPPTAQGGVRSQILSLCSDSSRSLGFEPEVRFSGPVDTVGADLGGDLLAVLREALSNVARHARAGRVTVSVEAADGTLSALVSDDGIGVDAGGAAGNGLVNISARAARLGGSCGIEPGATGGTTLRWQAPIR